MKKTASLILVLLLAAVVLWAQDSATNAKTRMESWDRHLKMKKESIFKDLKWRAVGPTNCGGRIESIAVHPNFPHTIYVGVGAGNIWKSINNGTTWTPIFENESTFSIGEVAIAPSDPNIVWVGTGEVLMARSSYAGTGVFKSTDAGKTWQNMGLHDTHHIGRVLIHPQDPDIVYVAAIGHLYTFNEERGLFKTEDGGKTWDRILYIADNVGVIEVEIDPSNSSILYACAWERDRKAWRHIVGGEGSALYKSVDAGNTWKKLTNGLPQGKHVGRMAVEVSLADPNVVYVLLDNQTLRPPKDQVEGRPPHAIRGEVYRSDDKGQSWRKVNRDYLLPTIGYDWNLLRISPDNADEIYVGGNRFVHSVDGGKTFRQIGGTVVHLRPKPKREFSLDQHALWIDPNHPDRLILGNDHGLYFTYDRTKTWLHVNNLPITEFYAISVDMEDPYNIYGGNQDNAANWGPSTYVVTDAGDDPWQYVYLDRWGGGDGFVTLADPDDSDWVYYFSGRSVYRKNKLTGDREAIAPQSKGPIPGIRYNWMVPFIISLHDPSVLFYGASVLFRSGDKGKNWAIISPDLTTDPGPDRQGNVPYGTSTTIAESPLKKGLIYVGTDDGLVHVTKDGGRNWTLISSELPDKWVSRVTASRYHEGTVYISLTGYREDDFEKYLYMSKDYGSTWTSITGNLPSEPINVVKEDPKKEGILYIGTDLSAYVSLDYGRTWHSLSNHLPTTPVYDMVIHPRENELVIGTHGRSCFVLDVKPIQNRK